MTDKAFEKVFKNIPPLTEQDKRKINNLFQNYVFFEDTKSGRHFACSHCQKEFDIDYVQRETTAEQYEALHAKHKEEHKCPSCGTVATFQSIKRGKSFQKLWERVNVAVVHPLAYNSVYISCYEVIKNYSDHQFTSMKINEIPDEFYYITPTGGTHFMFSYLSSGYFEDSGQMEPFYLGNMAGHAYYKVLGLEKIKKTFLKYSCYDEWKHLSTISYRHSEYRDYHSSICRYLTLYPTHPQFEMLIKMGLTDIVSQVVFRHKENKRLFNWSGDNTKEFFKLSKEEIRELLKVENNRVVATLKVYKKHKKNAAKLTINAAERFATLTLYHPEFKKICKKYNADISKIVKYIEKVCIKTQHEMHCASMYPGDAYIARTYCDYIKMADEVGYDLMQEVVAFPKSLQAAHENVTQTYNAIKAEHERERARLYEERYAEQIAEQQKKYKEQGLKDAKKFENVPDILYKKRVKQFEYQDKDFAILVPKSLVEIVDEGQALEHCVASYVERHAKGQTTILFMRNKNDITKPLYTIEYRDGHEMQIQGFRDKTPLTPEAQQFHTKWLTWVESHSKNKVKNQKTTTVA